MVEDVITLTLGIGCGLLLAYVLIELAESIKFKYKAFKNK